MKHLSDEELSRVIAEFLEPMPKTWPRGLGRNTKAWWFCDEIDDSINGGRPRWEPFNMVTDPAMTVMLLSHPSFRQISQNANHVIKPTSRDPTGESRIDGFYFSVQFGEYGNRTNRRSAYNVNLGRAVAEAFAKVNGLPSGKTEAERS